LFIILFFTLIVLKSEAAKGLATLPHVEGALSNVVVTDRDGDGRGEVRILERAIRREIRNFG